MTIWQKITNLLPKAAKKAPSALTISPSPTHSLAALSKSATHQSFLHRSSLLHHISLRTPFLRYSAQKLMRVARLLPGLTVQAALSQMQFMPQKAARLACLPLLRQAANACRQRLKDTSQWQVLEAMVGRGRYRRRVDVKGRGRVGVIKRPSCFLRLVVGEPNREKELRSQLLRHVNRSMRKMVREDKPPYLPLRY